MAQIIQFTKKKEDQKGEQRKTEQLLEEIEPEFRSVARSMLFLDPSLDAASVKERIRARLTQLMQELTEDELDQAAGGIKIDSDMEPKKPV